MYIVSRCLLGFDCKYNGGNNKNDDVIEFCKTHDYVTICPETEGGLESPRPPAEIVEEGGKRRVINKEGLDVTREFTEGAQKSLDAAIEELKSRGDKACIEGAILKANSPSCGSGVIYDGTFTGGKTEGYGIFCEMLLRAFEKERSEDGTSGPCFLFAKNFKIADEKNISTLVNE